MKIPLLILGLASLSFAIETQQIGNMSIITYQKLGLQVEMYKPTSKRNSANFYNNSVIFGYFKVTAKELSIYSKATKKSPIIKTAKFGDFLEIERKDKYGWVKFKEGGWGEGYKLYPNLYSKKSVAIHIKPEIAKKEINKANFSKKIKSKKAKTISFDKQPEKTEFKEVVLYKLISKKVKLFRSAATFAKNYKTKYKKGDLVEIDKSTKYGWLHIKNKGWVRGYKFKKHTNRGI